MSLAWESVPLFSCLRRPLFFQQRKKRGKETPPKTTFLDFLTRLRPQLISLVLPRERCAVEISPKCCIVSASLFAAAFALKCRAVQAWQEHFLNSGLWPPPTFGRFAAKARFDNRLNPRGEVSKGEGSYRPKAIGKEDSVKETHQGFLSRSVRKPIFALQKS